MLLCNFSESRCSITQHNNVHSYGNGMAGRYCSMGYWPMGCVTIMRLISKAGIPRTTGLPRDRHLTR